MIPKIVKVNKFIYMQNSSQKNKKSKLKAIYKMGENICNPFLVRVFVIQSKTKQNSIEKK